MKKFVLFVFLFLGLVGDWSFGQETATAAKKPEKEASKIPGIDASLHPKEPVTTEVFSDEAFFDSVKYMGTFTGHVKVIDPRFNLQADKLTIYVHKGDNQGLEKVVAEGNVAVVREGKDKNGAPSKTVGRAETATYLAPTGNLELRGTPRVQQGLNMQVATSPDTVMIINQDGQFTTHGPSRTDIRQEPTPENAAKKTDSSPTP
jgi:lipopolysaccharide transport protein LptA